MQTEIEAKWLTVNSTEMRQILKDVGATLISPERLMVRRIFDYPDMRLERIGGWVRVRNEGDKITLSYKQLNDRTVHGTKEVNVVVNDFDTTCDFLEAIGLSQTSIQETKRESWKLGDTEIEIDTWPWIPTFIEIEAKSEDELFFVANRLGLSRAEALHGSVEVAYQAVYNVSEEEIDGWQEIRFIDTPKWLVERIKKP
jgi:adenylate cyclase class 2